MNRRKGKGIKTCHCKNQLNTKEGNNGEQGTTKLLENQLNGKGKLNLIISYFKCN